MEFSRQEYWSGLPFPSPGDLPDPGLPHCRQTLYCLTYQGSPKKRQVQVSQLCPTLREPMDYIVQHLIIPLPSPWKSLSHVRLFATSWTIQSMEFSRPEYWSGEPSPSLGDLPNTGIKPSSPTLQADSLPAKPQGKPKNTGMGSLSLCQWIFPTQESNRGLLHCRRILYLLSHKGSPAYPFASRSSQPRNWTRVSCIAGGFFTNWAMREALTDG